MTRTLKWERSSGGSRGPRNPLFLDQTEAKLFLETPPPYPPPPPAPLSQGGVKYYATYGLGDHQEPIKFDGLLVITYVSRSQLVT